MSDWVNLYQIGLSGRCPLSPDSDRTADIVVGPVRANKRHPLWSR
jgi:hypothetical protein